MNKEVTIEAVKIDMGCKGCIWENQGCTHYSDDSMTVLGLPDCDEGYIYKIKEK